MGLKKLVWAMLGVGCLLCGSYSPRTGNPDTTSTPSSCPSQKVEAFRLIVEEMRRLPSSEEYYRQKPEAVQEQLFCTTGRQVARSDGMIEVFRIIKFDPVADRDGATVIYSLYRETRERSIPGTLCWASAEHRGLHSTDHQGGRAALQRVSPVPAVRTRKAAGRPPFPVIYFRVPVGFRPPA